MAFKTIREDEPLPLSALMILIYAPPGTGKTSLAFTAKKPLLFDYDTGLRRAVKRKTAVQFETWPDCVNYVDSEEFAEMDPDTLIFDTADTMLNDFIAQEVAKEKGNKKQSGALTQAGYGAMKIVFDTFFNRFKGKKHIIFICHEAEDKRDDKAVVRPKVTGGAYQILIQKADLIGYMEVGTTQEGEKTITLDFNPSDTRYAKNFAEFPPLEIPHYNAAEYDGYMERLIAQAMEKMSSMSEAQKEAQEKVKEVSERIGAISTLEDAAVVEAEVNNMGKIYKVQLANELDARILQLWEAEVTATENLQELLTVGKQLQQLKPRYQKHLLEVYQLQYALFWHRENSQVATTAKQFNELNAAIKNMRTDGLIELKAGELFGALKPLIIKLGGELQEIAAEKGIQFNAATKLYEPGAQKPAETKQAEKTPAKATNPPAGNNAGAAPDKATAPAKNNDAAAKTTEPEVDEMVVKEAKFINQIENAEGMADLEVFEDLIGTLEGSHKLNVTKAYNAKLQELIKAKA